MTRLCAVSSHAMTQFFDDDEEAEKSLADETPDESDMDEHDDPEMIACPYCRKKIIDDIDICPHCRNFISHEDAPRKMTWILITAVALLGAAAVLLYACGIPFH